jgi:hypothetical protein
MNRVSLLLIIFLTSACEGRPDTSESSSTAAYTLGESSTTTKPPGESTTGESTTGESTTEPTTGDTATTESTTGETTSSSTSTTDGTSGAIDTTTGQAECVETNRTACEPTSAGWCGDLEVLCNALALTNQSPNFCAGLKLICADAVAEPCVYCSAVSEQCTLDGQPAARCAGFEMACACLVQAHGV